jgi:uncharacterized membrane protein
MIPTGIALPRMPRIRWQAVATILTAAIALHLTVTLMAGDLAEAPAFDRLEGKLPVNTMQVLPPVTASSQLLPFMAPDARYAICRFDSSKGTVAINASLPGPGWTLSLHSPDGENFYVAVAQPGRSTDVSLLLIPTDERFTGLTPEAKGKSSAEGAGGSSALTLVAREGLAILRAPDLGFSYRAMNEARLMEARCGLAKS